MLAAGWSMKLVGWGVLLATWATPAGATPTAQSSLELAETESKPVELGANVRLILGSPDGTGKFTMCLGTRVGITGADLNKRAAAVAALEIRRDFVSKAFHEHFGNSPVDARAIDVLSGDFAALCISAPSSSQNEGISVVLEYLHPSMLTSQRWSEFVQRWRAHEGLASAAFENPLQHQLQSLIWLGNPEATASVIHVIEQSQQLNPEHVAQNAVSRPSKVVLAAVGDYSPAALEKFIRSHPLVREFTRAPSAGPVLSQSPAEIKPQTPRFTWERAESLDGHVWLFGWPISHLDATHATSLDVLAQLLERHFSEQTPIGKSASVHCGIQSQQRYGSFIVEVRSKSLDLATVDKWVRSGIDWLKNGQFSHSDLSEAIERAKHRASSPVADPVERGWALLESAYMSDDRTARHSTLSISPMDVSRIAQQDFDLKRSSEIYAEALPPRAKAVVGARRDLAQAHRTKGARPVTAPVQTNRRPGRVVTVQNGESLQMIARRFRVTVPEIIRENHLSHPDQIRPGAKIFIPQPESSVKLAK